MRPLGTVQRDALEELVKRGNWFDFITCGWAWSTPAMTTRIMESLVRRGLVQKERKEVSPACGPRDFYTPTQAGIDLAKKR